MSRTSDIRGEPTTYLTLRVWSEEEFRYQDIVEHFLGELAPPAEYVAPFIYVDRIRVI